MLPLKTLGEDPFLGLFPDFRCCLGLWQHHSSLHAVFSCVNLSSNPSFYKDTGHIRLGLTLLQNGLNLIASAITSFPNKVMFRGAAG